MKIKIYSGWEVLLQIMDTLSGQRQIYLLTLKACGIVSHAEIVITALNAAKMAETTDR